MKRHDFNRRWNAAADGVAANLIQGLAAEEGAVVRKGWRWKPILRFVVGKTRVTLNLRRRRVI